MTFTCLLAWAAVLLLLLPLHALLWATESHSTRINRWRSGAHLAGLCCSAGL